MKQHYYVTSSEGEGGAWEMVGHGIGCGMGEGGTWERVGHGRWWDMGGKEKWDMGD